MINHITKTINDWDPVGLFPLAPDDEYCFEIALIDRYLRENTVSETALGQYIHRMFTERFGSDVFCRNVVECTETASRILCIPRLFSEESFCQMASSVTVGNEIYYRLSDIRNLLQTDGRWKFADCILTPYYVRDGKRCELYEYELALSEKEDFSAYMEQKCGKPYPEIAADVIALRKRCFVYRKGVSEAQVRDCVVQYIDFLLSDAALIRTAKQIFGKWDAACLYCAVYM